MSAKDLNKDWPILNKLDTSNMKKVFVFENKALVLTNDGTISGTGTNEHKLIGSGSEIQFTSFNKISGLTKFKDLTTNGKFGLAITAEGSLYSWGSDACGQLGRPGGENMLKVEKVFAVGIKEAACGDGFSCVLTDDGKVYEWGINGYNEILLEHCAESDKPSESKGLNKEKILSIRGTGCYPVILTEIGKVYIPSFPTVPNQCNLCMHVKMMNPLEGPVKSKKIIQVLSGSSWAFALTSNGRIYQWALFPDVAYNPTCIDVEIGWVLKIWAAASHDVLVAVNRTGNIYSIIWTETGVLQSVQKIYFSSVEKYFAHHNMQLQGPVYDQGMNFYFGENSDLLKERERRFEEAFNKEEDSDIEFIIDGKIIYAHRAVLSIQSSYMKSILSSDWKQISENNEVTIKGYTHETYLKYLRYLYTGKLELSSQEGNLELLKLAHEYVEKPLLGLCKTMVIEGLTTENIFSTYRVASFLQLEDLIQGCKSFISENKHVIFSGDVSSQDKDLLVGSMRDLVCSKDTVQGNGTSTGSNASVNQVRHLTYAYNDDP